MSIIPRRPLYTNVMMVEDCWTMLRTLQKTVPEKVGRGATASVIQVPKFKNDPEIIKTLEDSIIYYKELTRMEIENKKDRIRLRDYQLEIVDRGITIVAEHGFVYLAMEVRTGKTLTALAIAEGMYCTNVLFLTKKKAVPSIEEDVAKYKPSYYIKVVNYESMHLVKDEKKWDMIVCDEAHSMGAFAKPSDRAVQVKSLLERDMPMAILLSGTPTPESYSQMYHQVYGIRLNPFHQFKNFYDFARTYVNIKQKKVNGMLINDYSHGRDSILAAMYPYTINYSQSDAGFIVETVEEVLTVEMKPSTYKLIERLKKDLVVEGKGEIILADTPVKLMAKVHQLSSGTIKFESGNSMVIDPSKAEFIKENFAGFKIGVFYKFKEELSALKQVLGAGLTESVSEFDETDIPVIALQIQSGREGISLRAADYLVYYNIDFSATSYWQSRDRMTTKDRKKNHIYWLFSENGIEYDIYSAVSDKKNFTLKHFEKSLKK